MKASDYIAEFLHAQGVHVVFEMIGGMTAHLIDSIDKNDHIEIVSMHHEQAAGFAAEAYGRTTGVPGVALATSGPGATNLVTAIGSCYFDSVPAVFITGQVNTTELSAGRAIRQQGFQETDIVSIARPVTKAAWLVTEVETLPAILDQAFRIAKEGRPGPVLVDIPMNIQRAEIAPPPMPDQAFRPAVAPECEAFAQHVVRAIQRAQRPLLLAGGGLRSAGVANLFREATSALGIPVVHSLMGVDLLPFNNPHRVGMIGTYGNRWANQALLQSDLLLVLGSRLDVRQTGADIEGFKSGRTIYHIDCDPGQLNNRVDGCQTCTCHLADFLPAMLRAAGLYPAKAWPEWTQWIHARRTLAPDVQELSGCKGINPNHFMHVLSRSSHEAATFLADVGKNQMWAAQSLELGETQRFLSSGGMGSMGFALPAAIGSIFASWRPAVCITGDGGIQCNIQELETASFHNLPLKIVVLNNNCLGMVSQFQEEYFESRMRATVWGYSAPDFEAVARAYNIPARTIRSAEEMEQAVAWLWEPSGRPALLNVMIDQDTKIFPKAVYLRQLNDMDPRID